MDRTSPNGRAETRASSWLQDHALAVAVVAAIALIAAIGLGIALLSGGGEETPETPPDGDETMGERPLEALVAVKVDNAEPARPQIGIDAARYLFEVPVEGGMTRFLALFAPGDGLVGPVRSARPVDVDLLPALSDVLVSTGGRPFVMGPLEAQGVELVGSDPEDNELQTLERPAPHNLFVSLAGLPEPTERPSPLPRGESTAGEPTEEAIEVPYADPVTWTYTDGVYTREVGGEVATIFPEFSAEPVAFTTETVVVMEVVERPAGYQDVNGVDVPTFDVIGSGVVRVYNQGTTITGTWSRASSAEPFDLWTDSGETLNLPEGRVFVHLLPAAPG